MGGHAETQGISTVFEGPQGMAGGLPRMHAFAGDLIAKVILYDMKLVSRNDSGCDFIVSGQMETLTKTI